MMTKKIMAKNFSSKKFTIAMALIMMEFLRGFGFELPAESSQVIQTVAMSYLGGQSVVDSVIAYKKK
jgi:hypothetical protein